MPQKPDTQATPPSPDEPTTARAREAQRAEAARAARSGGNSAATSTAKPSGAARVLRIVRGKKKPGNEPKSGADSVLELIVILVVALGLALGIQAFLVKPYSIPSESMVPTLKVGQRVLVNRIGHRFSDPKIGDIVVFHPPASATGDDSGIKDGSMCGAPAIQNEACDKEVPTRSKENFIKRVVAGPGDTVAIIDDHVVLNGKMQKESFIQKRCDMGQPANFSKPITIPKDHWYMMGDNRECSEDSRFWGPVPRKWIIGGAFATYWPPKRIGLL